MCAQLFSRFHLFAEDSKQLLQFKPKPTAMSIWQTQPVCNKRYVSDFAQHTPCIAQCLLEHQQVQKSKAMQNTSMVVTGVVKESKQQFGSVCTHIISCVPLHQPPNTQLAMQYHIRLARASQCAWLSLIL